MAADLEDRGVNGKVIGRESAQEVNDGGYGSCRKIRKSGESIKICSED